MTTSLKFAVVDAVRNHAAITGVLKRTSLKFAEIDIPDLLRTLAIPFHSTAGMGFEAGWKGAETGENPLRSFPKSMREFADRNTYQMFHPSRGLPRSRLFKPVNGFLSSSRAYYGFLSPNIIFYRSDIDNITTFQKFELLHELGHATIKGLYNFYRSLVLFQNAIIGIFIFTLYGSITKSWPQLLFFVTAQLALFLWYVRGRGDDEARADAFAVANLTQQERDELGNLIGKYDIPWDSSLSKYGNEKRIGQLRRLLRSIKDSNRQDTILTWDIDYKTTGIASNLVETVISSKLFRVLAIIAFTSVIVLFWRLDEIHSPIIALLVAPLALWIVFYTITRFQEKYARWRLGIASLSRLPREPSQIEVSAQG